jgi:hypothetical protein
MSRFQAILDRHRKYTDPRVQQLLSAVERYLDTGDPASIKVIAAHWTTRIAGWFYCWPIAICSPRC